MSLFRTLPGFSLVQSSQTQINKETISQYYISDTIAQQFQTCGTDIFLNIPIKKIQIYQKLLDQELPWYKKLGATISGIPLFHTFIYVQVQGNIFITIDFYKGNRITQRLAKSKQQVLQSSHSDKRANAKPSTSKMFQTKSYNGQKINVNDLRLIKLQAITQRGYSQVYNNCSHYCQRFMNLLSKKHNKN